MILSVPYEYVVVGYEPHGRRPVADHRRAVVDVLVEEADVVQAPVAVVIHRTESLQHRGGANPVAVRRIGDGLWVADSQAGRTPGTAPAPGPSGPDLAAAVGRGDREGNPFGRFVSRDEAPARPEKLFRREISSTQAEVEAAVRALANEVVAVDGVLHVRCPEPVLVRRGQDFSGFLPRVKVQWQALEGHGEPGPADVYRLDEWPNLVADARREAESVMVASKFDLPDELGWVEVRDASALTLPLEAAALAHAVVEAHGEMGDVVRRCAARARLPRETGDGPRAIDPASWSAPREVEVPDAGLVADWMELGGILAAGLDEPAIARVRAMMARTEAERAGWDEGDDRRRTHSDVVEAWEAVAAAFERWDVRPARLRLAGDAVDGMDLDALASVPA